MALLTITEQKVLRKTIVIKGKDLMTPTDTGIQIQIPAEHQAPTGKRLAIKWELIIIDDLPGP